MVGGHGLAAGVDFQDGPAAFHVRRIDHHLAVKASGAEQGAVEDFGTVGGRQQDHARVGLEAVHFHQQLVQRLLAFVVDGAEVNAALAADGVEFVDEDDAGGLGLGLLEEVADPGGPHAHEHLDEFAAAEGEEGDAGLAGHGAAQEGFARPWRADQEDALGDFGPQGGIAGGIFEEIDDLLQFILGFVAAGHVVEGDARVGVGHHPRLAPPETHCRLSDVAQAPREEEPQSAEDGQRQEPDQHELRQRAGFHERVFDLGRLQLGKEQPQGFVAAVGGAELERPAGLFARFRRRGLFGRLGRFFCFIRRWLGRLFPFFRRRHGALCLWFFLCLGGRRFLGRRLRRDFADDIDVLDLALVHLAFGQIVLEDAVVNGLRQHRGQR